MPEPSLEISAASVVLIGSFNPRIFQPEWFARQGLLPNAEAESANIQIIHQQVTQFETERFLFQVTTDRLYASTKPDTVSEPLRDLIVGTFYVLEHTPVQAMGLNRDMHFRMPSEEAWHQLGDKLAPKEPWREVIERRRPGLRDLQILYNPTSPKEPTTTITVQPSLQIQPGVYFLVNEHFARVEEATVKSLMAILNDRWEEIQPNAERIARHILSWAAS